MTSVQTLWNIHRTNIILSLKDMFDVSAVLLQNATETTTQFTDVWLTPARHPAAPHCISSLQQTQSFLLTMDGLCLPVFQYTAAVDYIQQPVQTGSAQHLMQEFPYQSLLKVKYEQLLTFVWSCHFVTIKFTCSELTDVFRTKWHWNVQKIMRICSGILKIRAVVRSGLSFLATLDIHRCTSPGNCCYLEIFWTRQIN